MDLSTEQIDQFNDEGYLVVPDVLSGDEIDAFLEYQDAERQKGTAFHLRSHEESDMWRRVATHPNTAGTVAQLIDARVRLVQTMYLPKKPYQGERADPGIALHQDAHYLPAEPMTLTACWIAMSDTDGDNGGLCVVPGSHHGALRSTHVNTDDDHARWEHEQLFRDREGKEWMQKIYAFQIDDVNDDEVSRLPVPRGAAVFFTGMTIHGSFSNHSPDRERLAFSVHYISEDAWLLRADVQDGMMVTEYADSNPVISHQER